MIPNDQVGATAVKKVGIQGVKASFHDVAARRFFSDQVIELLECRSFKELAQVLLEKKANTCLMAIENSIAGSILPNYSLLETHGFKISGEVYLRIEMAIMALPGQKLSDIKFVQSHPMAILQCEEFLSLHPGMKVLEGADTAESAKDIGQKKLIGYAAIASRLAAETYGLEVLQDGIETNKQNYTRFLVINRSDRYHPAAEANKASIRFEAAHKPGSLAQVLEVFSRNAVNMTKIQSVPILGRPYQYSFHVDLEWENHHGYEKSLQEVQDRSIVTNLIHFGEYIRAERPGG